MLERAAIADRLPTVRSAVSNGTRQHERGTTDGRSRRSRRFRDLCISFAASLGGERALSEGDRALVRTAATLVLKSEGIQAAAVNGGDINAEELTRIANAVARLMATLKRRTPPAGPSISLRQQLDADYGSAT
jgi:hypothetical protein